MSSISTFTREDLEKRREAKRKRTKPCAHCQKEVLMRNDQIYCSANCRAAHFAKKQSEQQFAIMEELIRLREENAGLRQRLGEPA